MSVTESLFGVVHFFNVWSVFLQGKPFFRDLW